MSVVAFKITQKLWWYIIVFSTMFYVTAVTLLLSFNKKGPGGDLISVDLIRFPGSIPGAIKMKMWAS